MPSQAIKTSGPPMPTKLRLKLANDVEDLLQRVKLSPQLKEYHYHLIYSKDMDDLTFKKMMDLFESLMREMYEKSSWGWNEGEKMDEWRNSGTRMILVTSNDSSCTSDLTSSDLPQPEEELIGFMCFRFETGANKTESALYVYELHVNPDHQRRGLGQELMRMAKVMAITLKMNKIMLTSFRFNTQALKFYDKLKFITDSSSPAKNESDYIILSSKIKS